MYASGKPLIFHMVAISPPPDIKFQFKSNPCSKLLAVTGCVFYIVDAFLDFGLEHNRNLNELILYFLFYYLDSFSLINFRSVSCGEGSLSPL